MFDDIFPDQQAANARDRAAAPVTTAPADGYFHNFGSGAGNYFMRSLAEAGRAASMAGAVVPIALDKMTSGDNYSGESLTDRYFKAHDEVFNHAVDYWTPNPGEVGIAGQVVGQLAGGVMQAVVSPALLVGTAQLSTAEDLTRKGVDPGAANVVGDIAGIGAAVGLRMPFLGSNLASRVASGVVGNVAQGAGTAAASNAVLHAAGSPEQAKQYDPLDVRARVLDAMLGAAFGTMAHVEAKLSTTDKDALLVTNQARHIEETLPGVPASAADLTTHAQAMRQAVEQVLRGEPVAVDALTKNMQMLPDEAQSRAQAEVLDEFKRVAAEFSPSDSPIAMPVEQVKPTSEIIPAEHNASSLKARQLASDHPDMTIATDLFDTNGQPVHMKAAEALAHADTEVANAQARAVNIFKTAAHCLLGAL